MFYNKKIILLLFIFCIVGIFTLSMVSVVLAEEGDILPGTTGVTVNSKTRKSSIDCKTCTGDVCKQYCGNYQLNDVLGLAKKVIDVILSMVGSLALLFFVYGGLTLLFSGGSEERVKKGKNILLAAIVGLVITFGSYLIIDFTFRSMGITDSSWSVSNWFEKTNPDHKKTTPSVDTSPKKSLMP